MMDFLWDKVLVLLKGEIKDISFEAWIDTLTPKLDAGKLVLSAKTEFQRELVETRYRNMIERFVKQVNKNITDVEVVYGLDLVKSDDLEVKRQDVNSLDAWTEAKGYIADAMTEISYKTWIDKVEAEIVDGVLLLKVSDEFNLEILTLRYLGLIDTALELVIGCKVKFEVTVKSKSSNSIPRKANTDSLMENQTMDGMVLVDSKVLNQILQELEALRRDVDDLKGNTVED